MSTSLRMATPVQRSLRVVVKSATISQASSRWVPHGMWSRSPGCCAASRASGSVQSWAATSGCPCRRGREGGPVAAPVIRGAHRLGGEDVGVPGEFDERQGVVKGRQGRHDMTSASSIRSP